MQLWCSTYISFCSIFPFILESHVEIIQPFYVEFVLVLAHESATGFILYQLQSFGTAETLYDSIVWVENLPETRAKETEKTTLKWSILCKVMRKKSFIYNFSLSFQTLPSVYFRVSHQKELSPSENWFKDNFQHVQNCNWAPFFGGTARRRWDSTNAKFSRLIYIQHACRSLWWRNPLTSNGHKSLHKSQT